MLSKSVCIKYYKRKEIGEALVHYAQNKEIGLMYNEKFGKRPDIIKYPRDVLELSLKGATSFHCSEESWNNPLALSSNLKKDELNDLREGWDLVLDIDCKFIEYSKISANLIVKFLKHMKVKNISCKFSGNKGFHIGVPFEAFPKKVNDQYTKNLFPEAPRKIAAFIKSNIENELSRQIMEFENDDFNKIKEKVELPREKIVRYEKNEYGDEVAKLNVDQFLEIDTILIASRHLFRMPYSLHEKSGLVSIPLEPSKVLKFKKEMAKPENVLFIDKTFLERNVQEESAGKLLLQSLDFNVKAKVDKPKKHFKDEIEINSPIKEEYFPPCVLKTLEGLEDGKKRAVFILINFLGKLGWNKDEIKEYLYKWNTEKNSEPLRENYIDGQLNYFKPGEKLPPNCKNEGYYKGMGICNPDNLCLKINNPVNYTLIKWKNNLKDKE
jgi:DNA primase large subunit